MAWKESQKTILTLAPLEVVALVALAFFTGALAFAEARALVVEEVPVTAWQKFIYVSPYFLSTQTVYLTFLAESRLVDEVAFLTGAAFLGTAFFFSSTFFEAVALALAVVAALVVVAFLAGALAGAEAFSFTTFLAGAFVVLDGGLVSAFAVGLAFVAVVFAVFESGLFYLWSISW